MGNVISWFVKGDETNLVKNPNVNWEPVNFF